MQSISYRMNSKRNTPKHIVMKMTKLKVETIKNSIEKAIHNTQENLPKDYPQ